MARQYLIPPWIKEDIEKDIDEILQPEKEPRWWENLWQGITGKVSEVPSYLEKGWREYEEEVGLPSEKPWQERLRTVLKSFTPWGITGEDLERISVAPEWQAIQQKIKGGTSLTEDEVRFVDTYLEGHTIRPPGFSAEKWLEQPEGVQKGYNYLILGTMIAGMTYPIWSHPSFRTSAGIAIKKLYQGKPPKFHKEVIKDFTLAGKPKTEIRFVPDKPARGAASITREVAAEFFGIRPAIYKTYKYVGLRAQIYKQLDEAVAKIKGARPTSTEMIPFQQLANEKLGPAGAFKGLLDPGWIQNVYGQINKALPAMLVNFKPIVPEEKIVEREMEKLLTKTPEEYATPEVAIESELQAMLNEVREAEVGKRIRTETGVYMAEPSTYPQWMRDYKISKNKALEAFETKKGITWQRIQDIAGDRIERGYESPYFGRVPSYMEQEINRGGGPTLGMGIELTEKELFTQPTEKNALGKAVDAVTSWFSVYTRIKKENPEAYRMFRHFKGGQELAWINAKQENESIWGKISSQDAFKIQRYRQNPEQYPLQSLPEKLRPIAQNLDRTMEKWKGEFITMGKMKVGWPESYVEQLQKEKGKLMAQIPLLKRETAIQRRKDRIAEIDELSDLLSTRRFFPGRYLDTPEGQIAIIKLLPEKRFRGSQIRSRWIKGKTIPDIDVAIKLGLQPIDPRAATLDYLYWAQREKNKWILYEGIKENPNLVLKEKDAPEFWDTVAIKELKGYRVNPLVTEILEEFSSSGITGKKGLPEAYIKLARYGKIASFYNPMIMGGIYDPQQGYLAAGVRVLNPVLYIRSIKSVIEKDEFYKRCVEADLFPKPIDLGPQRNMDDLILSAAKQMDESCPKFTRFVETITEGKWNFKGETNTKKMIKALSGLYSIEWNMTWNMDAASRMNTVKVLMAKGWSFEDAVERARFYHADYGDIPSKTRRFLNMAMWTPSYQISMAKVYGNLARHPIKEKGPLARLIAYWLLVGTGTAIAGYRWQEGYRFVRETEKGEDVITGSGPLFFLNKYLARNPAQSAYYQSAIPIHIVWSLARNRDWKGDEVYEMSDDEATQLAKGAGYIIRTYFRPLEAMGRMTDQDEDLLNRLLAIAAVSKYTRLPRETYAGYLVGKTKAGYRAWVRKHPEMTEQERKKHFRAMEKEIDKILVGPKQMIWQAPAEWIKSLLD